MSSTIPGEELELAWASRRSYCYDVFRVGSFARLVIYHFDRVSVNCIVVQQLHCLEGWQTGYHSLAVHVLIVYM